MIAEIGSVHFEIAFEKKRPLVASYLSQVMNKCMVSGPLIDFTVRMRDRAPDSHLAVDETVVHGIGYKEQSPELFEFTVNNMACRVRLDERTAEVYELERRANLVPALFTLLKLLTSLLVLEKGGLALHSSAVYDRNSGYVFCGVSGSGKSTIALRLRPRYTILSDEFNAVVPSGGERYLCFASPFTKQENLWFCSAGSSPLSRVFVFAGAFDTKPGQNETTKKAFLRMILKNVFAFPTSDLFARKLLDNASKFVAAVPIEVIDDRDALARRLLGERGNL
jgi:hypothetical protein